jgi:hypothetical protein
MANVLKLLGEREDRAERLEEAVKAYHATLEVFSRDRAPRIWAMIQLNLEDVLLKFANQADGPSRMKEALAADEAALSVIVAEKLNHEAEEARKRRDNVAALIQKRGSTGSHEDAVPAADGH